MSNLEILALVAAFIISCGIVYQDFKYRWVSLWLLLGFGGIGLFYHWRTVTFPIFIKNIGTNLIFVSLILMIVRGYFFWRLKKEPFIDNILGKADILILYLLSFWLSFIHFVYFYIVAILFSLISFLIYKRITNYEQDSVPLAGLLMIPFWIYWLINYYTAFYC